jgi:hypothetical protein
LWRILEMEKQTMKNAVKTFLLMAGALSVHAAFADDSGVAAGSDTAGSSIASGTTATIVAVGVGTAAIVGAVVAGSTSNSGTATATSTSTTH